MSLELTYALAGILSVAVLVISYFSFMAHLRANTWRITGLHRDVSKETLTNTIQGPYRPSGPVNPYPSSPTVPYGSQRATEIRGERFSTSK